MIPFPDKKYQIIYADPPWEFKNYAYETAKRGARKEYQTMALSQIKAMNIGDIADKDSILFLWSCYPLLNEALETIKSWGFEYKTVGFIWVKKNKKKRFIVLGNGKLDTKQFRNMSNRDKRKA